MNNDTCLGVYCERECVNLPIGNGRAVLSMKMGDFVNGNLFLRSLSRKKAVFLDETLFSRSVSKKTGIFLDGKGEMVTLSKKLGIFLDGKSEMVTLSKKLGHFSGRENGRQKSGTPERMSP